LIKKAKIVIRKKIEDEMGEGSQEGVGMDIVSAIAIDSYQLQMREYIKKTTLLYSDFWSFLSEHSPELRKVIETGSKINSTIAYLEQLWNKLQKINRNDSRAIRMYSAFLIEILNDKEGGNELLRRCKDPIGVRGGRYMEQDHAAGENSLAKFSVDGTPCIFISGKEVYIFNYNLNSIFSLEKTWRNY
jgi:hypothetical protein